MTLATVSIGCAFALVGWMSCNEAMAAENELEDDLGVDMECEASGSGGGSVRSPTVSCRMEWSWIISSLALRATATNAMDTNCDGNTLPLTETANANQFSSIELTMTTSMLRSVLDQGLNRCQFNGLGTLTYTIVVGPHFQTATFSARAQDRAVYFIHRFHELVVLMRGR